MDDAGGLSAVRSSALLWLCPVRPRTVSAAAVSAIDPGSIAQWGLTTTGPGGRGGLEVLTGGDGTCDGAVVAAWGRAARRLRGSPDHRLARYRVSPSSAGEVVVRPARPWPRAPGGGDLVVGGTSSAVPAVLAAAVPGAALRRAVVSPNPRRRTVFLVRAADGSRLVVKAGVAGHGRDRSQAEQAALVRLAALDAGHVPRPAGHGELEELHWSVETAVDGTPLARARRPWWQLHGMRTSQAIAGWLEELAVRTASPPPAGHPITGRGLVPSPAAVRWLEPAHGALRAAPAVMVHGDLVAGENVLVARRRFVVIDWETAAHAGLPLLDLLPLACWALARRRGLHDPGDQAAYVVQLCRGEVEESGLLLRIVRRYLDRLDLGPDLGAVLAAASWAHCGNLRTRSLEMRRAAGDVPAGWVSMSELVLDRWMTDPALGHGWAALRGGGRT